MADQQQICETYNYMDDIFRLSFGENADITCAMYNGDFAKSLEQAQSEKHEYILNALNVREGSTLLDIGCGWGPLLSKAKERKADGIGLTLSTKQAESCKAHQLQVYIKNWKAINSDPTFAKFDAIASVGSFEHFCSIDEYLANQQDEIYQDFFEFCYNRLPPGGRLFLQTMMWGRNAPSYEEISLKAKWGSSKYLLAVLEKFYPGSWLPDGKEQIVKIAAPYFRLISSNNGRKDYIQTMDEWSKRLYRPSLQKLVKVFSLVPDLLKNKDFRYKVESLIFLGGYNKECFIREVMDHERIVFERLS
ncbi:MAG: methyltransferase domain-containing protein [Symploca sp. SIO3E6]|nr:methyltransferase domain-containing protein [Caldora sp. SIO3E6]